MSRVNFEQVDRLYPRHQIKCVEEFHIPGMGWTSLVDGRHIATSYTSVEDQILKAKEAGASSVQLKLYDPKTRQSICSDFRIQELVFD